MIKIGDYIQFGNYYQTNETSKEKIDWLVLDVNENEILLISKFVLDAKAYNDDPNLHDITWDVSSIRKWLNGNFLNEAFSKNEQQFIVEKTLSNPGNKHALHMPLPKFMRQFSPKMNVEGGSKTKDKVFLLGWEEAPKYFKKKSNSEQICSVLKPALRHLEPYDMKNVAIAYEGLRAMPTKYALMHDAYSPEKDKVAWWWFRSPGNTNQMAVGTMNGDIVYRVGCEVNDATFGVRPLCWVKKEAFMTSEEIVELEKERVAKKQKEEQDKLLEQQAEWRAKGLCQHCGGYFKGFFKKICSKCGIKKDY